MPIPNDLRSYDHRADWRPQLACSSSTAYKMSISPSRATYMCKRGNSDHFIQGQVRLVTLWRVSEGESSRGNTNLFASSDSSRL